MNTEYNQLSLHLAAMAEQKGDNNKQISNALDISCAYCMKLINGKRDFADADRRVLVAAARYLNMPTAQVYLLAGALEPNDFVVEHPRSGSISDNIIEMMRSDPVWCGFVPSKMELAQCDEKLKLLTSLLYQRYLEKQGQVKVHKGK